MNVLNQPTTSQPFPFRASSRTVPAADLCPALLFPRGSVLTVVGEVHNWKLGWAGRIHCSLALSIGNLEVRANRETLSLEIGKGAWIRAKLMHVLEPADGSPSMHILSAVATAPTPNETSWVPVSLYHRIAGLQKLRSLLSTLEPGLQGLFMSVTQDRLLQRQLFWRPAASEHHCFPGGLADVSVEAAALANRGAYANAHDRGLATMASLLWDIGKVSDPRLQPDRTRAWPDLQPHPMTPWRLKRPLALLALSQPALAMEMGALLATTDHAVAPITHRTASLRNQVRRAVLESWGPADSFLSEVAYPGAAA